jgi:hypothetical protein
MAKLTKGKFGRLVVSRPLTDEGGGSAVGCLLYTIRLTEHVMKKQANTQKEPGPKFVKTKNSSLYLSHMLLELVGTLEHQG